MGIVTVVVFGFFLSWAANRMTQSEDAGISPQLDSALLDRIHFGLRFLEIDGDGEQEVGIARGKFAAFARSGCVHDGWNAVIGTRESVYALQVVKLAVPIGRTVVVPDGLDHVEPLLREGVAVFVLLRQIDAEGIVLGLVPPGDDVETEAPVAELVGSGELLGGDHGMNERRVDGSEDIDPLRVRQQTGRPRKRLQHAAVEVGFAAVTDPARDRQQKFDTGFVGKLRQADVVVPGIDPALGNFCDRHTTRAIRREETQFQLVAVQDRRLFSAHGTPSDLVPGFYAIDSYALCLKNRIVQPSPY